MTVRQDRNEDLVDILTPDFYLRDNTIVLGDDQFVELDEMTAPANPAADRIRVFARDDGGGTSQL